MVIGPAISSDGKKAAKIMHEVEHWIETEQENSCPVNQT